jgi:hypothetical protein
MVDYGHGRQPKLTGELAVQSYMAQRLVVSAPNQRGVLTSPHWLTGWAVEGR